MCIRDRVYRALGWELTVTPGSYLAVGMTTDRPDAYGEAAFLGAGSRPTQRLLVLRPGRATDDRPPNGPDGKAPPLALQAGEIAARGVGP